MHMVKSKIQDEGMPPDQQRLIFVASSRASSSRTVSRSPTTTSRIIRPFCRRLVKAASSQFQGPPLSSKADPRVRSQLRRRKREGSRGTGFGDRLVWDQVI